MRGLKSLSAIVVESGGQVQRWLFVWSVCGTNASGVLDAVNVHAMMMNANPDESGGLRERRLALGLTQQRLAELAGCSLAQLQLLERGYAPRRSAVMLRIAAALDTLGRDDP